MPGFCDNPNTEEDEADGMLTEEMVAAIVCYEATLNTDSELEAETAGEECFEEIEAARVEQEKLEAEAEAEDEADGETDSAASEEEG